MPLAFVLCIGACGGGPPPRPADPTGIEPPTSTDPTPAPVRTPPAELGPEPTLPAPPRPFLPPRVRWVPPSPQEGTALALWLEERTGGASIVGVQAELGGVPVALLREPGGWFGIAALPVDAAGGRALVLRYHLAGGDTREELTAVSVRSRSYPSARLRVGSRTAGAPPEVAARLDRERALIRSTVERVTGDWLARGGFDWPLRSRVTSPFGQRRVLNGGVHTRHFGVDVAGGYGTPVRAAGRGRVALTGSFLLQGNAIYLDHGLGVYTAYFHLSRISVREGDVVGRGTVIGRVGSTGRVTGPHLHWSLYVAGHSVDPRSLLELPLP